MVIKNCSQLLAVLVSSLLIVSTVQATGLVETTILKPGETKSIWSGWNVKGTLHFQIGSPSSAQACVTAWWNVNGFNADEIKICNGDTVPYVIKPYTYSRLKVGWPTEKTVVSVSTEASVNSLYEVCHSLEIDCL